MSDSVITAVSSLFAGSIARSITHPIDTIKAKLQVQQGSEKVEFTSMRDAVKVTLRNESIRGLYQGLPIAVVGSLPACVLYFVSYEGSKTALLNYPKINDNKFLAYLTSGMIAETVACAIFVPVDVIKERLQVQSNMKSYKYNGGVDAIR